MLVVVASLYVGVVFAGFTGFVERTIGAGKYEFIPIVMIGIVMGHTPDSWFAATFVGSLAQAFGLYVVLRTLAIVFFREFRKTMMLVDNADHSGIEK